MGVDSLYYGATGTVESDGVDEQQGDDPFEVPDVLETYFENMLQIFLASDACEDFSPAEFTEDSAALEGFTCLSESEAGRVVLRTTNYYNSRCAEPELSSSPVCVAASCNDDDAKVTINFILHNVGRATGDDC